MNTYGGLRMSKCSRLEKIKMGAWKDSWGGYWDRFGERWWMCELRQWQVGTGGRQTSGKNLYEGEGARIILGAGPAPVAWPQGPCSFLTCHVALSQNEDPTVVKLTFYSEIKTQEMESVHYGNTANWCGRMRRSPGSLPWSHSSHRCSLEPPEAFPSSPDPGQPWAEAMACSRPRPLLLFLRWPSISTLPGPHFFFSLSIHNCSTSTLHSPRDHWKDAECLAGELYRNKHPTSSSQVT